MILQDQDFLRQEHQRYGQLIRQEDIGQIGRRLSYYKAESKKHKYLDYHFFDFFWEIFDTIV